MDIEKNKSDLIDQNLAASLLGLGNPKTLAAWRYRRCGPPYRKIGARNIRYSRSEVIAWMDSQRQEA